VTSSSAWSALLTGGLSWRRRFRPLPWLVAGGIVGVFSLAPALGFLSLMQGGTLLEVLRFSPVQWAAIRETSALLAGVVLLAGSMGLVSAWLVAVHDFPLRRLVEIGLVLPLAFPTYLAAYVAVDLMDFFGPVQTLYRALLGAKTLHDYRFFDMRTLPGAIIVMALVLFPYVYVSCRLVFWHGGRNIIDAARLLGVKGWRLFMKVGIPVAAPALGAGLVLVVLETVNDIGATQHLGVSSFSVVISDLWLNRGDLPGAARLAGILIALVAVALLLARPRGAGSTSRSRGATQPRRIRLTGRAGMLACLATALPVLLGFIVPVAFLVWRAVQYAGAQALEPDFLHAAGNSLGFALAVSLAVMVLGALLTIAIRIAPDLSPTARIAAIGYAIPGTVLVLSIFPVLRATDAAFQAAGMPVLISGTVLALGFALVVRFIGIGAGQARLALGRLPESIDWVARIHGMKDSRLALRVYLPAMAPGLMLGGTLVFIDTVKELPATLLLRPLNFETLATRAYAQASAGTFEHAALESLMILAMSGMAALLLIRRT
jgi:iron(III) transport system permease protein